MEWSGLSASKTSSRVHHSDARFLWTRLTWSFCSVRQHLLDLQMDTLAYHIVDSAEDSATAFPLADDCRIVRCFVSRSILLTREATSSRLATASVSTEKSLGVTLEMLA